MTLFDRNLFAPTFSLKKSGDFRRFDHDTLNVVSPVRVDTPRGRYYVTPTGAAHPSVTTILGSQPKPELDVWREAVGEDEAKRISERASAFGTVIHGLAERYLLGKIEPDELVADKRTQVAFTALKQVLDANVNVVRGLELGLYSTLLGTAGTSDLLCMWNGVPSIVDFKTSSRVKHRQEIDGYFTQATIYSMMAEELTGIKFEQLVILLIPMDDNEVIVFSESRTPEGCEEARRMCHEYHKINNGGSSDYVDRLAGII